MLSKYILGSNHYLNEGSLNLLKICFDPYQNAMLTKCYTPVTEKYQVA